ncbi:MAG: hypothetical protein P1U67_00430 [Alcanivoracaceae bacterium]|nr:hypothetical protein [Alcanivoracaceae bacterium]
MKRSAVLALLLAALMSSVSIAEEIEADIDQGSGEGRDEAAEMAPQPKTIYKSYDADGKLIFTDERVPGAEPVTIRPANTMPKPKVVPVTPEPPKAEAQYSVSITSPENEQTFQNVSAPIPIQVSVMPTLPKDYRLKVTDNDTEIAKSGAGYQLDYVERGEHRIEAVLLNENGKMVSAAKPVVIFVHRTSVLLGPNADKPDPKPKPKPAR